MLVVIYTSAYAYKINRLPLSVNAYADVVQEVWTEF